MDELTQLFYDGAELARQQIHAGATCSLWGKEPLPPRGPKELLALTVSWFAIFSSHELKDEASGQTSRRRTLDFFIGWREDLTDELINSISVVRLNGKRYAIATEPRAAVAAPFYLRVICWPTGETD